jgi:hypothetical protein
MTTTPNLPVPPGATADDWSDLTDSIDGGVARALTWSRHDTNKIGVAVDGWQHADGTIDRAVSQYDADKELTAADARQLAAALLDAADDVEKMNGYDQIVP